jgi:CRISPR type IV-associated protein Csf3
MVSESKKPMTLRITAHLTCGVISDRFLPLDGILYYQVARDMYGPQIVTGSGRNPWRNPGHGRLLGLPIVRINPDREDWYYAASFAVWPEHSCEGQDHWNKRLDVSLVDLIDMQGRRGNIPIATGRYRSYHMPVFYRHASYVQWYLCGKRAKLERLLSTAKHIGKKGSQGWGAVREWVVEPWPEDWSVYGPGGKLMRAIPRPGGTLYGVRPSYWDSRNQCECALPE